MNDNIHTLTLGIIKLRNYKIIYLSIIMTHEQLLNKLYYEDLKFIGVNPLYNLAKKHDKKMHKEFVSNWLKNQSTQ